MAHVTRTYKNAKFGFNYLEGAAANTDIVVVNIKVADEIIFCLESHVAAHNTKDQTDNTTITEDGVIQISESTTSGNLSLMWISADS